MKKVFSWFWENFTLILIGCFAITAICEVIVFYDDQFSSYDLRKDSCLSHVGSSDELSAKKDECLSKDAARWGTFGDFFGGTLNPILSFLALIMLLKTYSSQREELEKTKKILEEQSEIQKRQQFESMFFSLLNVHNQLLQELLKWEKVECDDGKKRDFISMLVKEQIMANDNITPHVAQKMFSTGNEMWGHYFRTLYQLLKFIAIHSPDSEISDEFEPEEIKTTKVGVNEKMYSNIIRALLPDDIMKLVSVNCYAEDEDKKNYHKYKALIERYAFFEHASFNEENDRHQIFQDYPLLLKVRNFYEPEAFGRNKKFGK